MIPGRPPKIDRDEVISRAMRLFWTQGLERTSIQDIVAHTGLQRGSLYREFGDKRGLFLAAMERYIAGIRAQPWGEHDDPMEALEALLRFSAVLGKDMPESCLITKTLLEVGQDDPEIAAVAQRGICTMEGFARALLQAAAAQEQLRPGADVEALTRLCITTMQGFRVLSGTQSREQAETTVQLLIKLIRAT